MADGSWIRVGAIDAHLDARTVNQIIIVALDKRVASITQKPELRQAIGQAFVDAVTPFVPMKSGQLRESGRATDDGRVYWTATNLGYNYAYAVYDENSERWPIGVYHRPTTLNTYPRWVEKVRPGTAEWDAFVNNITPIIKEAFKDE
jgi:hypothetical protein